MSVAFVQDDGFEKRRKRACDICRRKKRRNRSTTSNPSLSNIYISRRNQGRCEGGDICSRCKKFDLPCTYGQPAQVQNVTRMWNEDNLPDSYDSDFVKSLQSRLETAKGSLRQIHDDHGSVRPPLFQTVIQSMNRPLSPPHPADSEFIDIVNSFNTLSLHSSSASDPGFRGKSSAAMLVKAAVEIKTGGEHSSSRSAFNAPQQPPLVSSLVALYFDNVNYFLPILHRPTFDRSLNQQLHIVNDGFGTILLLVCALGSLYLAESTAPPVDGETLAWQCYDQVELCGHSLRRPATLYDIQAYCFLHWSSDPQSAWIIAGFGLRLAQDVGFHRDKLTGPTTCVDEELEKRSEYDDAQWRASSTESNASEKSSSLTFFNCLLKLYRILHFSQRTLYTTRASQIRMGGTKANDLASIAAELSKVLDIWFNSMPEHLAALHPERPDVLFFDQSAVLLCLGYYTRITINRPFVPGLSSLIPSNPRALGICTEAARACIRVAAIQQRRRPANPLIFSQSPIFTAAMMLILTQSEVGIPTDMPIISTAIDIFKNQHRYWPSSGFFITVLERLNVIDQPSSKQLDDNRDVTDPHEMDPRLSDSTFCSLSSLIVPISRETSSMLNVTETFQLPDAMLPPAFVGDEEILPRRIHAVPPEI
ncbi:hypothetical protein C8R45DRAFT_1133546 [Mycena sanguinolenta]|nr:hypothetical protein C8R45DRAFT_1133546 [Mycena sanguinolenta]